MKNHDTRPFNHFQRLLRDGSIALVSLGLVDYTLWKKYRRLRTVRLHTIALLATALICCVAGGPVAAQTASPPSLVVLSGSAAPGGGVFILDTVVTPVINASGQIAFRTALSGAGSSDGIFAGAPGSLQAVARNGDAAPAGGNYSILNDPVLNSNGHVAFFANTSVSGTGHFARTVGFPATTAALVGTPSPTGDNYSGITTLPVISASGQVALVANLSGPGQQGIFAGTPGTIGLYDFTIDTGRYAMDRSGHGNHGIIIGAKYAKA